MSEKAAGKVANGVKHTEESETDKSKNAGRSYRRNRGRWSKTEKSVPAEKATSLQTTAKSCHNENAEKKFKLRNTLKLQRKAEIDQLCHLAGSDVVMLRKGQYVTTYSLTFITTDQDQNQTKVKCVFNIPLDYPQSAIKLSKPKDCSSSDPLSRIANNFNYKSKALLKDKQPLVVQLNYLVTNWNSLQSLEYINRDMAQKNLMSKLSD
ncbi:hypothetical protein KDRO_B05370 [Kluyveromyces lactis]|nr:hypothetical protein KDRO_B05370 [Kluyveromyces lactis]